MSSTCGWFLVASLGAVWLCFGLSQGFNCGKFEFPTNTGKCRPCRRCPKDGDAAHRVDKCMDTANPTPGWLDGVYWCQGFLDPWPECKKWSPPNGKLSCVNGMQIGTTCRLICYKDFYPSSNESVKCTGDLEWNKPLPYCVHVNDSITTTPIPVCLEWSPPNGYISCTSGRDVGSTCKLSCNQGFYPSSILSVTCLKQLQWDSKLPFCVPEHTTTTPKPSCKPLEVVNGTVNCSEENIIGSECDVKCNNGLTASVNKTITCTDNLTWSDSLPSCLQIQSPTPCCSGIEIENGTVSCTMDFDVGSYCNVSCSKGMEVSSYDTLFCRQNQTWNDSLPECLSSALILNSLSPTEENFNTLIIVGIVLVVITFGVIVLIMTVCLLKRYRRKHNSGKKQTNKIGMDIDLHCESSLIQRSKKVGDESEQRKNYYLRFSYKPSNQSESSSTCLLNKSINQTEGSSRRSLNDPFNKTEGSSRISLNDPSNQTGGSSNQTEGSSRRSLNDPSNQVEDSSRRSLNDPSNQTGGSSRRSLNDPSNQAGSSSRRSLNDPSNQAEGSSRRSFNNDQSNQTEGSSRRSLNDPSNQAGVSSNESINEDVLENCLYNGSDFPISENSASAEALKSISYPDLVELEKYFDRKREQDQFNWEYIAANVLKLSTHEIYHIEYKFKGHSNTGPTREIFRKMGEREITLFKVINYLESASIYSNVQEALKILYKYCDRYSPE